MSQYCTKGKIWLDKKVIWHDVSKMMSHMVDIRWGSCWCFCDDGACGNDMDLIQCLWQWLPNHHYFYLFFSFCINLHNGNLQNSTQIKKNTQEKWNRDSVRFKKIYIKHWMECVTYGQWKNNLISKSYLQYVIIWSICRQKSHDNEAVTVVE